MSIVMSVNAGSSSLKFQVYEMPSEKVLAKGLVERIGLDEGIFSITVDGEKFTEITDIPNHEKAVSMLIDALLKHHVVEKLEDIKAVGHRMVHGGEFYSDSVVATPEAEFLLAFLQDIGRKVFLSLQEFGKLLLELSFRPLGLLVVFLFQIRHVPLGCRIFRHHAVQTAITQITVFGRNCLLRHYAQRQHQQQQ